MFTILPLRARRVLLAVACLASAQAAFADDKTFMLGGSAVVLTDVSAQVGVRFAAMRFSPNDNRWLLDVALTNKSSVVIPTPLVFWVESFAGTSGLIGPDGTEGANPSHAYYDFTTQTTDGLLWPGDKTGARTVSLGNNSGAPTVISRVYAKLSVQPAGLSLVRALNEAGQPLAGVQVTEASPLGSSIVTNDPAFGLATLGRTNGLHTWRFSTPEHLPVWRRATLQPGEVSLTFSPRLTRRAAGVSVPLAGGTVTSPSLQVTVPPGAFAQQVAVTLTPLTAQTLPAVLPLGWSPLQAFWLEAPVEPLAALSANISLWGSLFGSENGALVWWNTNSVAWQVVQTLAGPATNVSVSLPKTGAFVVVVPDGGPWSPPVAVAGQFLAAANLPMPEYAGLSATGAVNPSVSFASRQPERVTAQANVVVTNSAGAIPSGLPLFSRIRENYALKDGSVHRSPSYENFAAGYQRPGDTYSTTLQLAFPMRPLLLFDAEALSQATVETDLLPPGDYGLRTLGPSDGRASMGNISVRATTGALGRREALYLRPLAMDDVALLSQSNGPVVAGFDLGISGIAPGRNLELQISGVASNALFVLTRVLFTEGLFGLEPVQRLASDGQGTLSSLEPASGERLPGITGAGQFALVRVTSAQGLITGVARNASGQAVAGLPVRVRDQPWLALSTTGGTYRLVAPVGTALVTVTDPVSGDLGQATANIVAANTSVTANPSAVASGPRIIAISPTNSAANVARVTPVVVQFSEPIEPASLGTNGVQLFGTNGQLVAASLTLNLMHTVATLLPVAQLAANTVHVIRVSSNITDRTGLRLEGPMQFSFTTESDALNRVPAQVTSYEPVNGMAKMLGSPGTAEPSAPVILVNETSGQTATILSKPDGSFSNSIPADVDDFLSAVLVNKNGTRNEIPVSRQIFRDGRVGLFHGGGILEAESDGGPVQVIVEPGSIPNKAVFEVEALTLAQVLGLVSNSPPTGGKVLGGFRYQQSGDPLSESPDIAFPIAQADLGLPPGVSPAEATFVLSIPRAVSGGTAYEIVDKMQYENGKLVTHSYPFLGLIPVKIVQFYTISFLGAGAPSVVTGKVLYDNNGVSNPVIGATVTAFGTGSLSQPGRPVSGTVFATSTSPEGTYVLAVPGTVDNKSISLVARHPAFSKATAPASVFVSSGLKTAVRDLVFSLSEPGSTPDVVPPATSIAHSPMPASIAESVILKVVSLDDRKAPAVTTTVESIVSLEAEIDDTDVVLSGANGRRLYEGDSLVADTPGPNPPNATGTSLTYTLRLGSAAEVKVRCKADDETWITEKTYTFSVGAPIVAVDGTLPGVDPNDKTSPYVMWSYPSPKSAGFLPGEAIRLRFSESISNAVLTDSGVVTLAPASSPDNALSAPLLELSTDQTELIIWARDLELGKQYRLELSANVRDIADNKLDQNPAQAEHQTFTLEFATSPVRRSASPQLPNLVAGGGIVSKGRFAYALERNGNGAVLVYDLSDPAHPSQVGDPFPVPGYPRDLKLIPQYSFKRRPDADVETKDLLAVVGGVVGRVFGQYLWIIDISDPAAPKRVAGTAISPSTSSAVIKVDWTPPVLSFLELGPKPSVNVVNLQRFIYGLNLTPEEYAASSVLADTLDHLEQIAGHDGNQDGDFVDTAGDDPDVLPVPERLPTRFVGWDRAHLVDTDQSIVDYTIQQQGAYVGLLLQQGHYLGLDGKPTSEIAPPAYTTVYAGAEDVSGLSPFYFFTEPYFKGAMPKRVTTLFGVSLMVTNTETETSELKILNLALVSLNVPVADGSTEPRVAVLDVTDPTEAPKLLAQVRLGTTETTGPYSIREREDGKLVLALRDNLVILDPSRLGMIPPDETPVRHPAVLGALAGVGSVHFSFFASRSGIVGVSDGGRSAIAQLAPWLSFVRHAELDLMNPEFTFENDLSDADLAALFSGMTSESTLRLSRYKEIAVSGQTLVTSDVQNRNPQTHYYVLVHAPGASASSDGKLELGLECLNGAGAPLAKKGHLFPPVRAISSKAQDDIHQTAGEDDAPTRTLTAWRMSSKPTSEFYNYFVSRPFVVLQEEISKDELETIQNDGDHPRDVLWSGHQVRAFLDSSLDSSSILHDFAATVDRDIRPGAMTSAAAFPADYVMGPNPAPVQAASSLGAAHGVIQAHNGELSYATVDLALPGRRMPVVFRRIYKGQDLFEGPFGRGWDFTYNQRIIPLTEENLGAEGQIMQYFRTQLTSKEIGRPGDLLFLAGDGRILLYKGTNTPSADMIPSEILNDPLYAGYGTQEGYVKYAPVGFYLPPDGLYDYFIRFQNGLIMRLEPDGTRSLFDWSGNVVKIEDRFQNSLRFFYEEGRLSLIKDELDRDIHIGYYKADGDPGIRTTDDHVSIDEIAPNDASLKKICRLVDYSGRYVRYQYDSHGMLEYFTGHEVTTAPSNPDLHTFTGRRITQYSYSDTSEPSKTGRSLVQVQYVSDNALYNESEPLLRVVATGARGRDTVQELALGTGEHVLVDQSFVNSTEELSTAENPKVTVTKTIVNAGVTTTEKTTTFYNSRGQVIQLLRSSSTGQLKPVVQEFDLVSGKVIWMRLPEGNIIYYGYDSGHDSLRSRGNLVAITNVADSSRGGGTLTAAFLYEPGYQLPSGRSTDFNNHARDTSWLGDGYLEFKVEVGDELILRQKWNEHGQLSDQTRLDGTERHWTYDTDTGFLHSVVDGPIASGSPTLTYNYGFGTGPQARGLPAIITDANGGSTVYSYNERDQVVEANFEQARVQYAYNLHGLPVGKATETSLNQWVIETMEYDQFGFMKLHTVKDVEVDGTATALNTEYTAVAGEHMRPASVTLPNNEVHTFTYDAYGRLAQQRITGVASDPSYVENYAYDDNNNLISTIVGEAPGQTSEVKTTYDGHDRVFQVQHVAAGLLQQFSYDGNGNVLTDSSYDSHNNKLAQTRAEYDAVDRLKKLYRLKGTTVESETSSETYDYSADHLTTTVTDPIGGYVIETHDTAGRLTTRETPARRVANGYLSTKPTQLANVRNTFLDGSGAYLLDQYTYNERNQALTHTDRQNQTTRFQVDATHALGYDGRVARVQDVENKLRDFTYTRLGEMASQKANSVTRSYTYDLKRNPRLASPDSSTGGGGLLRSYDSLGRLTGIRLPNSQTTAYSEYNSFNLPAKVEYPTGGKETRQYDDSGRLYYRKIELGTSSPHEEFYVFDPLNRIKSITMPEGALTVTYDKLGFPRTNTFNYNFNSLAFTLTQTANDVGQRFGFSYPGADQVLTLTRDTSGRLVHLQASHLGDLIPAEGITYHAESLPSVRKLGPGNGVITFSAAYDELVRPTQWKYAKADGTLLAEVRYEYTPSGMQAVRQFVHRGGRGDVFAYDDSYRLVRADVGARPALSSGDGTYSWPSFTRSDWKPGYYGRSYTYATKSDRLDTSPLDQLPDASRAPPFPTSLPLSTETEKKLLQLPGQIGDTPLNVDKLGRVTQTALLVPIQTDSFHFDWVRVKSTLEYDLAGHLVKVIRDPDSSSQVTIENTYGPTGLRIRRKVSGPSSLCVPSDTAYVYDGDLLLEEHDLTTSPAQRIARYYYIDQGDVPMAADFRNPSTGSESRYYFLSDVQGTVLAVADSFGTVVERVSYDSWGLPRIERPDVAHPKLARAFWADAEAIFVFTEPVLPKLASTAGSTVLTGLGSVANAFAFTDSGSGNTVSGTFTYDETFAGYAPGTVIRFRPDGALRGGLRFLVKANNLYDEWGNGNDAVSEFNLGPAGGDGSFTGASLNSTGPDLLARSSVGSLFLFHGQVFDYDSGLVYLRARFYDPSIGLFLQPDPMGFEDSANLYAAFANNPANARDPSGTVLDAAIDLVSLAAGLHSIAHWDEKTSRAERALDVAGVVIDGISLLTPFVTVGAGVLIKSAKWGNKTGEMVAAVNHAEFLRTSGGLRDIEIESLHEAAEKLGITEIAYRAFGKKAAARIKAAERGLEAKPLRIAEKTGPDAIVKTGGKTYVSDIDLAYLKIGNRVASPVETEVFTKTFGEAMSRRWKAAGLAGEANIPIVHGAHLDLARIRGTVLKDGTSITDEYIRAKAKHPGEIVRVLMDRNGITHAGVAPHSVVDSLLGRYEQILKNKQFKDIGESFIGPRPVDMPDVPIPGFGWRR